MLKVCQRCHRPFIDRMRWCPHCYGSSGRLRAPVPPPPPPRRFQLGQRVRCTRDFSVTGGRKFCRPVGRVLTVSAARGGTLNITFRPDDWPTPEGQWPEGVVMDSQEFEAL